MVVFLSLLGELLGEDMLFYTFEDFIKLRKYIKDALVEKDKKYQLIYGLYIESRPFIKNYYRGVIRDYVNDYITEDVLIGEYLTYKSSKKKGDKFE